MTSITERATGAMVRLELPFPPSVNGLTANASKGRVKTPAYRAWFALASTCIKDRHRVGFGPYSLSICLRRPDKRRRDLGNLEKAISDLLVAHGVVRDDSLSERISLQWDAGLPAECVVLVQPYEGALAA
jgi:crossover junction endodeoxyribonuclease RusA